MGECSECEHNHMQGHAEGCTLAARPPVSPPPVPDIRVTKARAAFVAKTVDLYEVGLYDRMMPRAVTALNNLLRTQARTLPADDYATLACLRDTFAQTLASGKICEGRLSTYE